jgi:hypothetical protein
MPQIPADFLLANAGQLSMYTMKGCDKVILRRKGGASRERIKTEPNFENTRRVNAEFGGRATCSKWIRRMLHPLKFIADYNITGPLNALLKPIQELDTISNYGERSVAFSANPHLLEGFNLNKRSSFDTIVHNPVRYTLSKRKGHASVTIPAVLPGHNFSAPGNFATYRFIALLGIIPDLFLRQMDIGQKVIVKTNGLKVLLQNGFLYRPALLVLLWNYNYLKNGLIVHTALY